MFPWRHVGQSSQFPPAPGSFGLFYLCVSLVEPTWAGFIRKAASFSCFVRSRGQSSWTGGTGTGPNNALIGQGSWGRDEGGARVEAEVGRRLADYVMPRRLRLFRWLLSAR